MLLDFDRFVFLTHLAAVSTPAKIIAKVDAESAINPLMGLQQAELFIYARLEAIAAHRRSQQQDDLDLLQLSRQRRSIDWLTKYTFGYLRDWIVHRLACIDLQLAQIDARKFFTEPLVRDALEELRVAMALRSNILDLHPQLGVSYAENLAIAANDAQGFAPMAVKIEQTAPPVAFPLPVSHAVIRSQNQLFTSELPR